MKKLLQKCCDNEGSKIECWIARTFFKRSFESTKKTLQSLSSTLTEHQHKDFELPDNLWSKVSARIAEEQYLDRLHDRKVELAEQVNGSHSRFHGFFQSPRLSWGMLGTALSIIIVTAVVPSRSVQNSTLASSGVLVERRLPVPGVGLPQAQSVSSSQFDARSGSAPMSFDVDWVRSSGKVNIMRLPDGETPVLWVKRRSSNSSSPVTTPYMRVGKAFVTHQFPQ